MSTLWTPSGEHEVPRDDPSTAPAGQSEPSEVYEGGLEVDPETGMPIDPRTGEPFDPIELAEMEAQLREAQEQLTSVPAAEIVQNHMMGLFELAALHLRLDPPDLAEARLPIDALGLLVENLGDQLPAGETLMGALQQIRLTYVEIHKRQAEA